MIIDTVPFNYSSQRNIPLLKPEWMSKDKGGHLVGTGPFTNNGPVLTNGNVLTNGSVLTNGPILTNGLTGLPPLQAQLTTHQIPLYGSVSLPPLYTSSNVSQQPQTTSLPIYNESSQESENISDKEIHQAALEGVKRSYMKQLVRI